MSRLYQIAEVLDVSIRELLGIEPPIDNIMLDRIKDLESQTGFYKEVLRGKKEKEEYQQRVANQLIEDAFDNAASDLLIGVWELTEKATGKKYQVVGHLLRSIKQLPNYQEIIEGLWYGRYAKKRMVKDEDMPEIKKRAIEMDTGVLSLLNTFGLIKDEEFSKQIEESTIGFPT